MAGGLQVYFMLGHTWFVALGQKNWVYSAVAVDAPRRSIESKGTTRRAILMCRRFAVVEIVGAVRRGGGRVEERGRNSPARGYVRTDRLRLSRPLHVPVVGGGGNKAGCLRVQIAVEANCIVVSLWLRHLISTSQDDPKFSPYQDGGHVEMPIESGLDDGRIHYYCITFSREFGWSSGRRSRVLSHSLRSCIHCPSLLNTSCQLLVRELWYCEIASTSSDDRGEFATRLWTNGRT